MEIIPARAPVEHSDVQAFVGLRPRAVVIGRGAAGAGWDPGAPVGALSDGQPQS